MLRRVIQNARVVVIVLQESGRRLRYRRRIPVLLSQPTLHGFQVVQHVFVGVDYGDLELEDAHYEELRLDDGIAHVPVFLADLEGAAAAVESVVGDVDDVTDFEGVVLDFSREVEGRSGNQLARGLK